ncbi:hypothetical protein SAMN05421827_12744 [Pedobacter terrae]|uniref:Uncharacterized protein n=1 Tax=Pedobacter terrae TaxID=405671 RepID=A0A1G8CZH7_9SPHI|nr:hypothetical protein SAMN05421827_12744 [Pedobacter terrae]
MNLTTIIAESHFFRHPELVSGSIFSVVTHWIASNFMIILITEETVIGHRDR